MDGAPAPTSPVQALAGAGTRSSVVAISVSTSLSGEMTTIH